MAKSTTVKVSKKNSELANRIVTETGSYFKDEQLGNRVELLHLGIFTTPFYKTKKEATNDMVERVGQMLEDGSLQLSDTWVEDNLEG